MQKRGEGGWFTIPGVQEGERTLEEAVRGLELLEHEAHGKSVLDLGCAEGLVGQWFVQHGAGRVDGVDINRSTLATAREISQGLPMWFDWADLNRLDTLPQLRPTYHIVLLLSVLHKLKDSGAVMHFACLKARHWLAVRAPGPVVVDLDIVPSAQAKGFVLAAEMSVPSWTGVFFRCT